MNQVRDGVLQWQHVAGGIYLRTSGAPILLPPRLAQHLVDTFPCGLSLDPALDIVELDRRLQETVLELTGRVLRTEQAVSIARAALGQNGGRRAARRARTWLAQVVDDHAAWAAQREQVLLDLRELRDFVIDLRHDAGALSALQRGWRLNSSRPGFVEAFSSESAFLEGSSQRGVTAYWGGTIIAGEPFGLRWRRDGDDHPRHLEPSMAGVWTVFYNKSSAEVVAHRVCDYLPEEIWLLGQNCGPGVVRILRAHQCDMGTPNSLIDLAIAVHFADVTESHRPEDTRR